MNLRQSCGQTLVSTIVMPEKSCEGFYRKAERIEHTYFTVITKRKVKTWWLGCKEGAVYRFQGRHCCCCGAGNHPVAFVCLINEQDRVGRVEMLCKIYAWTVGCTSLKMCKGWVDSWESIWDNLVENEPCSGSAASTPLECCCWRVFLFFPLPHGFTADSV